MIEITFNAKEQVFEKSTRRESSRFKHVEIETARQHNETMSSKIERAVQASSERERDRKRDREREQKRKRKQRQRREREREQRDREQTTIILNEI